MSQRRSTRGSKLDDKEQSKKVEDTSSQVKPEDKEDAPSPSQKKLSKKKKEISETHAVSDLQDIAHRLRIHSIDGTNASKSGHPTSCSSMAELMAVLFFDKSGMHYDAQNPQESFNSDRFVLSQGHAAPILWAAWAENGYFQKEQILTLRQIDSDLEGHPTPRVPFVDIASGSLGQGLAVASGMAYTSQNIDKINNHFWVLLGDGQCAEGSVWEAANFAGHYKLNNLTAIIDVNRLGQSEETQVQHNTKLFEDRFAAFGWSVRRADGHDILDIIQSFDWARASKDKPTCIVAKTFKGKYFPEIEDKLDWHGKPIGNKTDVVQEELNKLIKSQEIKVDIPAPDASDFSLPEEQPITLDALTFKEGEKIATRKAYGEALKALGKNDPHRKIVALDGDTKNSTFSLIFQNAYPNNFIECFIAEQTLVGVGCGVAARQHIPFCSTFAAFFSRAYDHIRMAGISHSNIKLVGSHSGVSIGEDGPSQMALEDFAMFRAIPNCVVLYPTDAVSTFRAVELAANHKGMVYIRTSRPETQVIYPNDEKFELGLSQTIFKSDNDKICIVSGGITLEQAFNAAKVLAEEQIHVRVVDIFSLKPIDKQGLIEAAKHSNNLILTIEDHYAEGGIFEAVSSALSDVGGGIRIHHIAVNSVPRSGTPEELLRMYSLDQQSIIKQVKSLL